MPELSPECIERLRDLEGQLNDAAMTLDISPADADQLVRDMGEFLQRSDEVMDEECRRIFKELEPQISSVIKSISGGDPDYAIRQLLDAVRDRRARYS